MGIDKFRRKAVFKGAVNIAGDASLKAKSIDKAELADDALRHEKIAVVLVASKAAKLLIDKACEVVHVSFYNQDATAFSAGATVKNGAAAIASSSATLAGDTVEEKEDTGLTNTSLADGDTLILTAGDKVTAIVVTVTSKINI